MNIFPTPQRYFDPNNKRHRPELGEFVPGGKYLTKDNEDITGYTAKTATISVIKGISFEVHDLEKLPHVKSGRKLYVNLFKKSAGWKWLSTLSDSIDTLISVEKGGIHYYAVAVRFNCPLILERYPNLSSEPRLRPTTYMKEIFFFKEFGKISIRSGEPKTVYSVITIS